MWPKMATRSRSTSAKPVLVKRVTRGRRAASANYDRLSAWYDWLTSAEDAYVAAGRALLDAHPGQKILEIGCGTGRSLVDLAHSATPGGQVLGLDLSPGMLRTAAAKIDQAGLHHVCSLIRGDGLRLPLAGESCDLVFISFTLELFDTPEIPQVLAEVRRVLIPGGQLGVVALSRAVPGIGIDIYEYLHERWPVLLDCRPIYPRDSLKQAGFAILTKSLQVMWGLPVEIILTTPA